MDNEKLEEGLNWYQILAIICLGLYVLFLLILFNDSSINLNFITIATYVFYGIIGFSFMYGFGKIISLLAQINAKLDKNNSKAKINKIKKEEKVQKNDKETEDIPWELRED